MPTPLGYLTENARTPYPFKEGCSLLPTGQANPLANDVFLDFQFTTTDAQVRHVALTQLKLLTGPYSRTITLTFTIFKQDPITFNWSSVIKVMERESSSISRGTLFTSNFSGVYKIKIVPGAGMVALCNLTSSFTWNFKTNISSKLFEAEMSPATVIPIVPHVTTIHFKNVNEPLDILTVIPSGAVTLQADHNVVLNPLPQGAGLVVQKGVGAGLYNPCEDPATLVIKSINAIEGENFVFSSGDCYNTVHHISNVGGPSDPALKSPGLEFIHTCRAKCTQTEVTSFAYYVSRIQDAVNHVTSLIADVVNRLNLQILDLETKNANRVVSPYIDIQDASTVFNNRNYQSVSIGIYDPNKQKMTCDLVTELSSGVADNSYYQSHLPDSGSPWNNWVLHPTSTKLDEENNNYTLPSTVSNARDSIGLFADRGIDCRGSVMTHFVLHGPTTLTNQWVKVRLTVKDGATTTSTAFKYHNIQPIAKPYFNVRSRRGLLGTPTKYVYTISIDLFDSDPDWSPGNTTLSVVVNSGHSIHSPVLKLNNGQPEPIAPAGSVVGFSNRAINYPERAVLTFNLESLDSTAVDLSIALTVGVVSTTVSSLTFE